MKKQKLPKKHIPYKINSPDHQEIFQKIKISIKINERLNALNLHFEGNNFIGEEENRL